MKIKSKESKNSLRNRKSFRADKQLTQTISLASKVLAGEVIKGKAVEKVCKGRGPWRYLIFKDKSYLPVKKGVLLAILSDVSVRKCLGISRKQNKAGKINIAMKCLLYRSEHSLKLNKVPHSDHDVKYEVNEGRVQEFIKTIGIRNIKKIKTPCCELCNSYFAYYFGRKTKLLDKI